MHKKFCGLYIEYIFEYIIETLKEKEDYHFDSEKIEYVKEIIEKEIFQRVFKSLLYCMNVERLDGNLYGNTSEERYEMFSNTRYCIETMGKNFPTMKYQIYDEMARKCVYIMEVIDELENNKNKIGRYFGINPEEIVQVQNSGDWHDSECVLIFTFKSQDKIIYKPTRGENLQFMKGLMDYFFEPAYAEQYIGLCIREGTWVKYVKHIELTNPRKVEQFYYNYGKVLFVAYILGMNDIHYENLIACGEYPVITDVETIFSSYLFFDTHTFFYDAQYKAVKELLYGTMATGMLPIFSMTDYFGGDVSCLSNKGIKLIVEKIKNEYRDDMYICTAPEMIVEHKHLPNHKIDPLMYGKQIVQGFEEAGITFQEKKAEIKNYILNNMEKVESRIILNMTKGYSKIVRIKSDPRYRHDPELFRHLLTTLKRSNQFNPEVYEQEVTELCRSNIPSFYWKMDMNYVYGLNSGQKKKILDLPIFSKERLSEILEYQVNIQMLEKQRQLIYDAILSNIALGIEYEKMKINMKQYGDIHAKKMLRSNIDQNCIVGSDGTISWLGLMVNDKEQLEYAMLDWSLYSGIIGIGYMYISEYDKDQDVLAKDMLQRIVCTLAKSCDLGVFKEYDISYFCGLTGIYAFLKQIKARNIIEPDSIGKYIKDIQEAIRNNIVKTSSYDTMAGIHSAVIYYFGCCKQDTFSREILSSIEDYFLNSFKIDDMKRNFNYASFAHGYSGVMTSIMCMLQYKYDVKLEKILCELWKQEKELHIEKFVWKDMRTHHIVHSHYWCHGSLGIMMARLIWKKFRFDKKFAEDISEENLEEMLSKYKEELLNKKFQSKNYSLCHGNFALVDFLISYRKILGTDERIDAYIEEIIEHGKESGYSCVGAPGAINSIGFMVGEAGIQYTENRIENSKLYSVLMLETV